MGRSGGTRRGGQSRPEARPPRQSRGVRAGQGPRPDRDPGGPGSGPARRSSLPLRHQRMAESAFAYYRGTPAVMAFDLASTPRTDIIVQASGDAHLSNFGLFASPERTLVFDANDFDETLPGPWEWDVKRLAASIVIAGRANGFNAKQNRGCDHGDRPQLPPVDGAIRGHAPPRGLVHLDHRDQHPRGRRGQRPRLPAGPRPVADSGWRPSSARPASVTACVHSSR